MKDKYRIEHNVSKHDSCICVSNYGPDNEIIFWSFINEKELRKERSDSDIGMWRIKQLKTK